MCRQSCPSEFISYRESDTPRGRAIILQSVYKTGKEFTPAGIEAIYNCFVCGSCTSWCAGAEVGHYDIPELIKYARRDIVKRKLAPEAVQALRKSLIDNENRFGINKSESFTAKVKESKADILYLAGEEINFRNKEIAEAMMKIFRHLKAKVSMLRDEPSSGKVLDLLGYLEDAKKQALKLAQRIKSSGCKTVVISDPLTLHALRKDFPEWSVKLPAGIKVLHSSEYIAGLIRSGKIKLAKSNKKVTLADSEFLGRFNNIYDPPREIIKSTAESSFTELKWNRDKLLTTGESALTFDGRIFPFGKELGEKIAVLVNDIRAKYVITLSAAAKNNLSGYREFRALEISEFVADLI
jgi:Fe-S oxidoreductase